MQTREKILAGALGGSLLLAVVVPKVATWWNGPVRALEADLRNAEEKRDEASDELNGILQRQANVADAAQFALPGNPERAALLYQRWLTDTAEQVGRFSDLRVIPERIVDGPRQAYKLVRARVTGRTKLAALTNFLALMERTHLQHRILSVRLTSGEHTGDPVINCDIAFEGLSLETAPERDDFLFPQVSAKEIETYLSDRRESLTGTVLLRSGSRTVSMTQPFDEVPTFRSDDVLEVLPVDPAADVPTDAELQSLVESNVFAKPDRRKPVNPSLDLGGSLVVARGKRLELSAKIEPESARGGDWEWTLEWTPPAGESDQSLADAGGRITWTPAADLAPVKFPIGIKATRDDGTVLSKNIEVVFNSTPELTVPAETISPGEPYTFPISLTDADLPNDAHEIAVEKLPEGMTFDPQTRQLAWTPPLESVGKIIEVPVRVTDRLGASISKSAKLTVGEDPLRNFRLTFIGGGFQSGAARVGYLKNRQTGVVIVLKPGVEVDIDAFNAVVTEVLDEEVLLEQDDATLSLSIGDSLRETVAKPMAREREPDGKP